MYMFGDLESTSSRRRRAKRPPVRLYKTIVLIKSIPTYNIIGTVCDQRGTDRVALGALQRIPAKTFDHKTSTNAIEMNSTFCVQSQFVLIAQDFVFRNHVETLLDEFCDLIFVPI